MQTHTLRRWQFSGPSTDWLPPAGPARSRTPPRVCPRVSACAVFRAGAWPPYWAGPGAPHRAILADRSGGGGGHPEGSGSRYPMPHLSATLPASATAKHHIFHRDCRTPLRRCAVAVNWQVWRKCRGMYRYCYSLFSIAKNIHTKSLYYYCFYLAFSNT